MADTGEATVTIKADTTELESAIGTLSKTEPKAGLKATEFWLTLFTILAASVLCFTNHVDATQWMTVATGSSGAYAISRGLAKKG